MDEKNPHQKNCPNYDRSIFDDSLGRIMYQEGLMLIVDWMSIVWIPTKQGKNVEEKPTKVKKRSLFNFCVMAHLKSNVDF